MGQESLFAAHDFSLLESLQGVSAGFGNGQGMMNMSFSLPNRHKCLSVSQSQGLSDRYASIYLISMGPHC